MGTKGGGAPPAPDYTGAALAEGQAAKEITEQQTWANRPQQYSPWGASEWTNIPTYDPVTGQTMNRWQQTISLTPDQQEALNAQMRIGATRSGMAENLLGRAQQEFGQPVGWTPLTPTTPNPTLPGGGMGQETLRGLTPGELAPGGGAAGPMPAESLSAEQRGSTVPGGGLSAEEMDALQYQYQRPGGGLGPESWQGLDPNAVRSAEFETLDPNVLSPVGDIRNRAEEAIYNRAASRLDPQFEQEEEALQSQLWNQGLRPGDEAWDMAMGNFSRRRTDAYQTAMNEAIMGGGVEAERQFGMGLSRRQQAIGEEAQAQEMEMARRRAAAGEYGSSFERELARRQQGVGEAERAYELGLAGRGLYGQEVGDVASRELARRQQLVGETAQEFEQGLAGRQQYGQELQDIYGRAMGVRGAAEAERQAAFAREAQRRQMEMAQSSDWFQRELARRQQGVAEAETGFGMGMAQRQQALAEEMQRRGWSLNEISAILSGQQIGMPGMPSYQPAARAQPPQLLDAAQLGYQADLNAYNAAQMQQQGLWGGLMGAAATAAPYAMMFSDRRLKSNIERVGTTPGGQPIYTYTIFDEPRVGVMADESPPHAVWRHPSGFLMVDYSRIR